MLYWLSEVLRNWKKWKGLGGLRKRDEMRDAAPMSPENSLSTSSVFPQLLGGFQFTS